MLRSIIQTSLQFRFLVVALAAVLMLVGFFRLRDMPVDVLPEFAPPYIEVQTEALGLSAPEVESLVTLNIEELVHGVPWQQTIRSRSVPGLSSVIIVFQPGTDIYRARQMVQERLILARHIPNVSQPPVALQPLSATSRVMIVGLTSKEVSPIQMGVLARWKIRPALMGVPGVANVSIWGQRERQLQVRVDPEWMRAHDVTLDQVIRSTGDAMWSSPLSFLNASAPGTGGWFDTPQQRLDVRHVLPVSAPQELANVSISGTQQLRLGDVAQVVEDHQPLIGDAVRDAGPSLLLVVEKFPGTNTLEVTSRLDETLKALRPGLPGIEVDGTIFRPASFIEMAMSNLTRTLLISAALGALALLALLFQWRVALISLVAIPLSLTAAAYVLSLRGETLNVMLLAGLLLALVLVVDDAVVDPENIARRLRRHRQEANGRSAASAVFEALIEMRRPLIFATLITLLAVLPVFLFRGVAGGLFDPLARSYTLAVLASMVVALTITPALSLVLLAKAPPAGRESPLLGWLQRRYDAVLARVLRTPFPAYGTAAVLVVAGLATLPFVHQQSLLPTFGERQLLLTWEGAPGTSHPEMVRITTQAIRDLRTVPGVTNVGAHVGRAVLGDEVAGVNVAKIWVSIAPTANYGATVAALQDVANRYPGLAHEVQTYLQKTLREAQTGSSGAIVARIYGPEWPVLRTKAEEVKAALAGIPGVVDLQSEPLIEEPQIEIQVDFARAQRYGINPGDVRRAASTLVNGLVVGQVFEQQKIFDVVIWSTAESRNSVTALRELLIDTPGGGRVRLEDVAEVRIAPTLNTQYRDAVSRKVDVSLNVRGRDPGAVARDVERRLERVSFPLEYHAELIGEYAEREADQWRILGGAVVAALGTFLLLHAAFQRWRLAALAFCTLPWALTGGLLAAVLFGGGMLSLTSLLGLVAVLGIAMRNGIVLISHFQHLEQAGEPFGPSLVARGARERLGPIVTTAVATGLALAPLVLFGNIPGLEVAHPMAVVILGGLVTSTLLNLLVVPVLYLRFAPRSAAAGSPAPVPASA